MLLKNYSKVIFLVLAFILEIGHLSAQWYLDKEGKDVRSNENSCECFQEGEPMFKFAQLISQVVSYEEFHTLVGWQYYGGDSTYGELFFKDFHSVPSSNLQITTLTALSFEPIRMLSPDKAFVINFTPCKDNDDKNLSLYGVPLEIHCTNNYKKYSSTIDYKTFDYSAKSYFDILVKYTKVTDEDFFLKLFSSDTLVHQDSLIGTLDFISILNQKYKIALPLDSFRIVKPVDRDYYEDVLLDSLKKYTQVFKKNKINLPNVFFKEFISSTDSSKTITKIEEQRLLDFFTPWVRFSLYGINKKIVFPEIDIKTEIEHISIEVSENIIRLWNPNNSDGNSLPTSILASGYTKFSSINGLDATNMFIECLAPTEITGTGITIDFENAAFINPRRSKTAGFNPNDFPLFFRDSILLENKTVARYDSSLAFFSGLFIHQGTASVLLNKKRTTATLENVILNNNLIAGTLVFNIRPSKNNSISILNQTSTIQTTIQKLEQEFLKNGFDKVLCSKKDTLLKIYFKKTNPNPPVFNFEPILDETKKESRGGGFFFSD